MRCRFQGMRLKYGFHFQQFAACIIRGLNKNDFLPCFLVVDDLSFVSHCSLLYHKVEGYASFFNNICYELGDLIDEMKNSFYLINRPALQPSQLIINTFTLRWRMLKAISAIRFSLSRVGFTSVISRQQTLCICMNLLIRSSASRSFNQLLTGVPVPLLMDESRLSTSNEM